MRHERVKSSNIYSIGYENGILEIRFHHGGLYQYKGANQELFEDLLKSDSKGKFFCRYIRDNINYPYAKVA